jgi:hypothetical protein
MWSDILSKFFEPRFTNHLANKMATWSRQNLNTSTNIDGSQMTTNKKSGRPLIDTGDMLRSISAVDNTVTVNVPYAKEVQSKTGNYFIGTPPNRVLVEWLNSYD